ncbi:hypothetical protein KCP73_04625 [Salmonella enterica subsp. enterica]|nr:hypothetical protein KCP73_04625 [Salmonella enterica subsp. enterica]
MIFGDPTRFTTGDSDKPVNSMNIFAADFKPIIVLWAERPAVFGKDSSSAAFCTGVQCLTVHYCSSRVSARHMASTQAQYILASVGSRARNPLRHSFSQRQKRPKSPKARYSHPT